MELDFKKCDLNDLALLVDISIETFRAAFESYNNPEDFSEYIGNAFSRNSIKEQLENPNSHFYLVYDNELLIAYIKINLNNAQTEILHKNAMELERIYVLTEFIGSGYGEIILRKIKDMASAKKVDYLWLGVWEKNQAAIRFYERHGFEKISEHSFYLGKDKQTDWLMKWDSK